MNKKIISILVSALLLASCGGNSNEKKDDNKKVILNEEHHHSDSEKIELNSGEKWKVKDEMMVYIRTMEKEVNTFATSNKKEYKTLAQNLQKNIELLTSSCTMTGKAHDELHKWLLPYIDLANHFSQAKTEMEEIKLFENIHASFITFNQFFK